MRAPTLLALVVVAACNHAMPTPGGAKSVFALTGDDFQQHQTAMVDSQLGTLTVAKGDLIYFTASGTLSTRDIGSVGPAGDDGWGGTSYPLVNRRSFGLYGQIGESVFFIGNEAVILAPEDGTVELIVNACASCSMGGQFSVDIYTKLRADVTLGTTPELTDNTVSNTTMMTLDGAQGWQSTGVTLDKGQKVFVDVGGTFKADDGVSYGADGDIPLGGASYLLTNRFVYRVYGRVGDNVFDVGKSAAVLAPSGGMLELVVNHTTGMSPGTGLLSVTVGAGLVPARGLETQDTSRFTQSAMLSVLPDGAWHASTGNVHRGDPLVASATGQLTGSSVPGGSADAYGSEAVGGISYALTNRPIFALFGRVGSETFFLGGSNAVLSPADGPVELLINAAPGCSDGMLCDPDAGISFPPSTCAMPSQCDVQGSFSASYVAP